MNKIFAVDNLKKNNWSLDTSTIGPMKNDLYIGFTEEQPIAHFKNLRFGFELRQGENIKQYAMFPKPNVRYVQTDQEYLEVIRLNTVTDQTYDLFLWAENDDIRIEKTFELTIPRPEKPYESWVWNIELLNWESPTPYPEDGKDYTWNEETQSWQEVELSKL